MKKHYSQMTTEEIRKVLNAVKSNRYTVGQHAMDRMDSRKINENQILSMLTYCNVIEAHNDIPNEIRVLVRGKVAGNFCCAVVSLTKKQIVTCYTNQAGDFHKTLDKSKYAWKANMAEVV